MESKFFIMEKQLELKAAVLMERMTEHANKLIYNTRDMNIELSLNELQMIIKCMYIASDESCISHEDPFEDLIRKLRSLEEKECTVTNQPRLIHVGVW